MALYKGSKLTFCSTEEVIVSLCYAEVTFLDYCKINSNTLIFLYNQPFHQCGPTMISKKFCILQAK